MQVNNPPLTKPSALLKRGLEKALLNKPTEL